MKRKIAAIGIAFLLLNTAFLMIGAFVLFLDYEWAIPWYCFRNFVHFSMLSLFAGISVIVLFASMVLPSSVWRDEI